MFFYKLLIFSTVAAALVTQGAAQTVTVAKTGTPTFSTVQDAINSFTPDPDSNAANVISITDSAVYNEVITINAPLTLQGTGASRPVLAVKINPAGSSANDGIVINVPTGTSNTIALKNLIVIPSITTPPTDDAILTVGQNIFLQTDNLLITANNGSDVPVTTTGLAPANTAGATFFGDDGMTLGLTASPAGEGVECQLKNTVISLQTNTGARDGLVLAGTTNRFTVLDGCVFSFCGRLGIQAHGDFEINATKANPTYILNNSGFAGLWFAGGGVNKRSVNNAIIANNGNGTNTGFGIEHQSGNTAGFTLTNSIVANNTSESLHISDVGITANITLTNDTFAKQTLPDAPSIAIDPAASANVSMTNCIVAGNGSADPKNTLLHNGSGTLTLSGTALVTAGPQAMATATGGTGPVSGSPTTTADPQFVNTTDPTSASYFDVASTAYATANSTGGPLAGGADFVGGSGVNQWSLY